MGNNASHSVSSGESPANTQDLLNSLLIGKGSLLFPVNLEDKTGQFPCGHSQTVADYIPKEQDKQPLPVRILFFFWG